MTQAEIYKQEIARMESVIKTTDSFKLKNDYTKAVRRMKKELLRYNQYHKDAQKS